MKWLIGRRMKFESDMADEIAFHLEQRIADLVASGLTKREAERKARMEFGSLDAVRDDCRATRPFETIALALRDARLSLRRACRNPLPAIFAAATLAIGIAAVTLTANLVYATFWKPLPFASPDRIGLLWAVTPEGSTTWLSPPEFDEFQKQSPGASAVEAITDVRAQLLLESRALEVQGVAVSHGFLALLGLRPELGRDFDAADDTTGSAPTIILSHPFWAAQFNSDPSIIGRTLTINERQHKILGVLPKSFVLPPASSVMPDNIDFLTPMQPFVHIRDRNARMLQAFVRAQHSFVEINTALNNYGQRVQREFPTVYTNGTWRFRAENFQDFVFRKSRAVALCILLLAIVILAAACVNVTNLLLVRGENLRKEVSVRVSLGATRRRLAWALLVDILTLVTTGATLAMLFLSVVIPALQSLTIDELPHLALQLSFFSLLPIVVLLSLLVAFVIAPLPLAQQAAVETQALSEQGRSMSRSRSSAARGRRLVAAQLALASASVIIALSLSGRLRELQQVNLGFEKEHLITARVSLTSRYSDAQAANRFLTAAIDRLKALPGVLSAGATTQLPLSGAMLGSTFMPDHRDDPRRLDADLRGITPGFLNAAGTPLLAGRDFTTADSAEAPGVAIVDEVFARRLAPGGAVLGQCIRWFRAPERELRIVGIVRAVHHRGPAEDAVATVYRPFSQYARRSLYLVARTSGLVRHTGDIADVVSSLDAGLSTADVQPMEERWERATSRQRLAAVMSVVLAVVGLLLACGGVYGVLAFDLAQRRLEFGIRLAIGANPSSLVTLVLRQTSATLAFGLITGLCLALAFAGVVRNTEYWSIHAFFSACIVGMICTIMVTAAAAVFPAKSASKVPLAVVLSGENTLRLPQ